MTRYLKEKEDLDAEVEKMIEKIKGQISIIRSEPILFLNIIKKQDILTSDLSSAKLLYDGRKVNITPTPYAPC